MPTVSVIIPTYNRADLICQAINSVLAQTHGDFEIIVVDDGSTDNTREAVQGFSDERVRYIWQQNQQRCVARNNGLKHARGELVAFLDSDDLFFPWKFERELEALGRHPDAGAVYGRCIRVGPNLELLQPHELLVSESEEWCGDLHADMLVGCMIPTPAAVMVRRELLDKVGEFDASLPHSEDWDMWIRLSAIADFCRVNGPVGAYRVHPGNRSGNLVSTMRGDLIILDKHSESLSFEMRQKAELASYANHASRAPDLDQACVSDWITSALGLSTVLRSNGVIRRAFVDYAASNGYSIRDYREMTPRLESAVRLINSLGGSESKREWLGSFWGAAIHVAHGIGDHRLAVQAFAYLLACGGIGVVDRGVISSAVRSMLALARHPGAKRKPLPGEREIGAFLLRLRDASDEVTEASGGGSRST